MNTWLSNLEIIEIAKFQSKNQYLENMILKSWNHTNGVLLYM